MAQREDDGGRPSSDTQAVVGIGASAGGLAALKRLFEHTPDDTGLVFVVVVHLSPDQKSHLAELLQSRSRMPVEQVNETVKMEPNRVYVIPPNANLNSIDTHLRLTQMGDRSGRAPIDHFFRTLASTHDGHAVGVILTGTGSDGALGIKEIKMKGGLTIVQDPNEAEFDGMPQSALATGLVDLVLPLDEIVGAACAFARTQPRLGPLDGDEFPDESKQVLHKVFTQVRARTGRDFSRYKRSTILRRIGRRMQIHGMEDMGAYLELLRKNPDEVFAVADDFLITVTSFFRDAHVFAALEKDVVPSLFQGKGPADDIRVWSVGCATGEEAYSVAMLFVEEATRRDASPRLQVFASDLHAASLDRAREGFYPGDIETDVATDRLRRFFHKENGGYRIRKELRDLVVFAPHNLLGDPPFSHIDLLVCRNVLIYLQRDIQRDVVELFHYSLRPDGFLLLGTAETLDDTGIFKPEEKKLGLYRKRNVVGPEPRLPVFPLTHRRQSLAREVEAPERAPEPVAYGSMHHQLVEQFAPPSLLVSPDDKVLHLSEHAGRYLLQPGGELTANVYRLLREDLRIELRAALQSAREKGKAVRCSPVRVRFNGDSGMVQMHVRPASRPREAGFVLVFFEEIEAASAAPQAPPRPLDGRERELQAELDLARQRLQAIIEEYETSQEEMRASNEELQSTNEELRSTLEELETSKEELQSMNEELHTVNQENRHKVEELSQLSSDLNNLLVATDIATLFLDRDLRILRFTPSIGELFNVRATDRGRPLSDLTHRLGYDDLNADAEQVLARLVPIEREVQDESGRWYMTRVLPYRSTEDRIEGVVLTFVDVSARKESELELREAKEYAEHVIETLPDPLLVLDLDLRVRLASAAFFEHFHVAPRYVVGRPLFEVDGEQWNIPELRSLLAGDSSFQVQQLEREFGRIGRRVLLVNGRRLEHLGLILLGIRDITDRHEALLALRESEERFRVLVEGAAQAVWETDAEGAIVQDAPAWTRYTGQSLDQMRAMGWLDAVHPGDRAQARQVWESAVATGHTVDAEFRLRSAAGGWRWTNLRAAPLRDPSGRITRWVAMNIDITDRREAEEALRDANRRKEEFLATLAHELRNPLSAIRNGLALLRIDDVPPDVLASARDMMERQLTHLVRLIDDLLDMNRINRGTIELRLVRVDLVALVRRALDSMWPRLASERRLELDLPAGPVWLDADSTRLTQVVGNLLDNAHKFTAPGERIRMTVARRGETAMLAVADDGPGISADKLEWIFEMFAQGGVEPTGVRGGLGIGLTLVRKLVELHGGTVEVESKGVGHGSTFTVLLPIRGGENGPPAAPATAEPRPELTGHRVLVVDDNRDTARSLAMVLQMHGNEVREAYAGEEALRIAAEYRPDLVLLDIGLPGLDGHEVARRLRREPWGRDAIVLAVTGWGQTSDAEESSLAGFDGHLVKPLDPDTLGRIVADVQARRSQRAGG